MIEIKVENDGITGALKELQKRLKDLTPIMRSISQLMEGAVQDNFEAQGRPAWKSSKRAIEQGGKTMQDTGRLAASIVSSYTAKQAVVGTNVVYAAIHQFGGRTKPRIIVPKNKKALWWPGAKHPVKKVNHPGSTIPARPFLALTDSDFDDIGDILNKYLTIGG